jgi:hypothetical protein
MEPYAYSTFDRGMWAWFTLAPLPATPEEQREAHRRLGEWWTRKQYIARFDRCCHGKKN